MKRCAGHETVWERLKAVREGTERFMRREGADAWRMPTKESSPLIPLALPSWAVSQFCRAGD